MRGVWRLVALAIVVGALVIPLALHAVDDAQAGGSWSAWVYNRDQGRLVHIFPDGVPPVEMAFPLPPGTSQYPDAVAISRDGAYLAACLTDNSGAPSVRVYDIYNQLYVAAYIPSGPIQGCSLTRYAFSEDNTQVAFGILNHWPNTPGDTRPDWELVVMQLQTSAVMHRVTSSDPAITALGQTFEATVPFVVTFQMATATYPGVITFKPVRWGTEGACEYESLVWQLNNGTVSANGPYGKSGFDVLLPNSEILWVDESAAFTPALLVGMGCPHNVVMYANKIGAMHPIFHDGTNVLWQPVFIEDGTKVAVNSYSSASDASQWKYVDRAGIAYAMPVEVERDVWGTPDGYVFFATGPFGVPEVRYHRLTTNEMFVLWNGLSGEYWRMVWVNPLTGGGGLPPFPALPVLGPPPGGPVPTNTVSAPGPAGVLQVGGRARINTTEGDTLRVRTGPGFGFAVAYQYAMGTQVSVLEGPMTGDGHVWWRVLADDGRGGWVVEGVTENGSYLPTLLPVP